MDYTCRFLCLKSGASESSASRQGVHHRFARGVETPPAILQGAHTPIPTFPDDITLSTGRVIPVRWLGEQHVRKDLGFTGLHDPGFQAQKCVVSNTRDSRFQVHIFGVSVTVRLNSPMCASGLRVDTVFDKLMHAVVVTRP